MALYLLSREARIFRNRQEAGRELAGHLPELAGPQPLVLAIPRGGVIVGGVVADELGCDLDVVIVRKLGAPGNPELAVGSIMEGSDEPYLNEQIVRTLAVSRSYLGKETETQKAEAARRGRLYRNGRQRKELHGRTVILVDDGIATGATMISSIEGVKAQRPDRIVVALPVGPPDAVEQISELVDDLLCLSAPAFFAAVGQFYQDFSQTTDEEVVAVLDRFAAIR